MQCNANYELKYIISDESLITRFLVISCDMFPGDSKTLLRTIIVCNRMHFNSQDHDI